MIAADTGPLVALAKINQLTILSHLFGDIFVPPAVRRELLAKIGREADYLDEAFSKIITVAPSPAIPTVVEVAISLLDKGEQEAIALAYERQLVLLIDERLGRVAARHLNLAVTGTAGVLLQAKQQGLITAVSPLLQEARQKGYWLSEEFLTLVAKMAEEE